VAEARVLITADSTRLAAGLAAANGQLATFAARAKSFAGSISAAFGGITLASLAIGVKKTIDSFEELNAASQRTGVTVEALSALKYAAEQSETSFEGLQKGLVKLARLMQEARDGNQQAAATLAKVGVTARDTVEGGLDKVTAAFAAMPDGVRKTSLAFALFGKSGAELIPLLNSGADGLAKFRVEAERMGIIVSTKSAAAADQFNDSLDKVGRAGSAVGISLANTLLPTLGQIADKMAEAAASGDGFWAALGAGTTAARNLMEGGGSMRAGIGKDIDEYTRRVKFLILQRQQLEKELAAAKEKGGLMGLLGMASTQADLAKNTQQIMAREQELQKLYKAYLPIPKAADDAGKAGAKAGADAAAADDAWAATLAKVRGEYVSLQAAMTKDIAAANANPLLAKDAKQSTVLDVNRLKDLARTALEGGDTETALDMISKARDINKALYEAGSITKGYYETQASQLLELAKTGQQVVDGEPIVVPAVPDLESAIAAGQIASATAQSAVTPIVIPSVSQTGAASFSEGATTPAAQDYAAILAKFKAQNPQRYAAGGLLRGPGTGTSDSMLAQVSNGEYVVNAASTRQFLPLLQSINRMRLPRFATGGSVSTNPTASYRFDLNGRSISGSGPAEQVTAFASELRREVLRRGRR
jgi:hypothetical protein